jgi:hypothetical protein
MTKENHTRECIVCGREVAHERWKLGYKLCLPCGEIAAKKVVRTVAPMHKSNYMMITDLADLRGLNNKGGLVK